MLESGQPLEPSNLWNFLKLIVQTEASPFWGILSTMDTQTLFLSPGILFTWPASQVKTQGIHFTSRFTRLVDDEILWK